MHEDSAGELERAEFQHLRVSWPAEVFGKALRTEVVTCIGAEQVEVQGFKCARTIVESAGLVPVNFGVDVSIVPPQEPAMHSRPATAC